MNEDKRSDQCDFNASTGAIAAPVTRNYPVRGNIFQVNIVANSGIVPLQAAATFGASVAIPATVILR